MKEERILGGGGKGVRHWQHLHQQDAMRVLCKVQKTKTFVLTRDMTPLNFPAILEPLSFPTISKRVE